MWKLVQNAHMGWQEYMDAGKLAALLIAAIGYLWICGKCKGPRGRLLRYGTIGTILCICPLTAAALMLYQTRFYDYQWIWSMVPVTALIAFGGTVFLTNECKSGNGWKTIVRNVALTIASVLVLFLCGGLGAGSVDAQKACAEREHSKTVLEAVRELDVDSVCLWAPAEILKDARLEGDMSLLYGRNMWDISLNAYSYDVYSQELCDLYVWMEHLTEYGMEISLQEVQEYMTRGFDSGANCILLPVELLDGLQEPEDELRAGLEAQEGVSVRELEEYIMIYLR